MAKPWRMVTLHLGAWITLALFWAKNQDIHFGALTVLDWTCIVVIVGCVQTVAIRLKRIMAALEKKSKT